jgi:uncharacterized membrane protein YGL010W
MSQYAQYHRDRRNIVTHFVGIPLIVFAVGILLARVSIAGFTLAWIAWALSAVWYLTRGNLVLGVATSLVNAVLIWLAHPFAALLFVPWLSWGVAAFALGWFIQFVGHYYGGVNRIRDNVVRLAELIDVRGRRWLFALGWNTTCGRDPTPRRPDPPARRPHQPHDDPRHPGRVS